jgi:hypothetical protein
MGRFSEYGLQDNKERGEDSVDPDKRTYFCPFTQLDYKRGFYLGFAHFILSLPAAHHFLKVAPELAGSGDRWEECFRCKDTPSHLHYYKSETLGICAKCAQQGWNMLRNPLPAAPEPPPPPVPARIPKITKAALTGQLSLF